jgi:hypothetical protein
MTRYYKEVELVEGAAVVFVGCHVLRWQREWGEPKIGFIDADEVDELLDELTLQLEAIKSCITLEGAYFHAELALEKIKEIK